MTYSLLSKGVVVFFLQEGRVVLGDVRVWHSRVDHKIEGG